MKKIVFILLVVALLSMNFIMAFYFLEQKVENRELVKNNKLIDIVLIKKAEKLSFYRKLFKSEFKSNIASEFLNQIVQDTCGNESKIISLLDERTLFYIYSENTCTPCVEQEITLLNNYSVNNNIIIVSNYKYMRKFKLFCQLNNPRVKTYNGNCIDFLDMNNIVSYYFVLDSKGVISDFYFPDKYSENSSEEFLNSVFN